MSEENILKHTIRCLFIALTCCSCVPSLVQKTANRTVPKYYNDSLQDSLNIAKVDWKTFFTDANLNALIDTALKNNQELNIILQEMNIAKNEIKARKGEYLPFLSVSGSAGMEKPARYTRRGALEANTEIAPGKEFPEPLQDYGLSANFSWEIDIWRKLRNTKKSTALQYLSTFEGKNFMLTRLIAEIAYSYYELMALDNQFVIVNETINIQKNALKIVKLEKQAGEVTELAVRKFQAEVLKNQSRRYYIQQKIVEAENKINFLLGRFPQHVKRDSKNFIHLIPKRVDAGIPSQLLNNRPDIKQAELQLSASKLDIKVAKANFFPSFRITAGIGFQAFNLSYFLRPESLLYSLAGDLVAPLINRNALKAAYSSANAKQIQAVYNYERTILQAYTEVANQISKIDNLQKSYDMKEKEVEALTHSIRISTSLFKSARADYMEVLMTQRDALEAKIELIETKMKQMNAFVKMYQSLGGGWK